jgi:hypothetical protein
MYAELEAKRVRGAANERQKKMVEESDKLLKLATELKSEADRTAREPMSADAVRKAEEIEKLAHDVKQRMKG